MEYEVKSDIDATFLSRTLASTQTLQLAEIHCLDAFYTPIEERFERLTRLAKSALRVQVAAVTAVTQECQWFKSVTGWDVTELSMDKSLCANTVIKRRTTIVQDLSKHPRYATHPLVLGAPKFRFYAGVPLSNAKGSVIGTLCVMSLRPRRITEKWQQLLEDIAELAQRELLTIALHDAQTELVAKLSHSRRQALLDPLTRVWNRRGGMALLDAGIERAKKDGTSIAVCAVDINHFKSVNDTFGHAIGDRALRLVARELLACVRDNDGVCRFGGDEFFVMFVGTKEKDIGKIADRVRERIHSTRIRVGKDKSTQVSVDMGIQYCEVGSTQSAKQVLDAADKALYRDKRSDRNAMTKQMSVAL
jgi:diguanylate cyclase (GGDEF)-like protein